MKYFLLSILFVSSASAVSIKDYKYYSYKALFTNPICKAYEYDKPVESLSGDILYAKPENVYCKRSDKKANLYRKDAPHYNIKKLILNKDVNELFLTYLSFSNSDIANALCTAIKKNNTKVIFIIDSNSQGDRQRRAVIDKVGACLPYSSHGDNGGRLNLPRIEFRGNVGGLGYAHNKIIMAKYKTKKDKITIVFSSGNMSSGTILHHENWHFVTTSTKTYFAQIHECIKKGMLDHAKKKSIFKKFIGKCRASIKTQEEDDIKVFVVPSDGDKAMANIVKSIEASESVDVAFHRFTNRTFISALQGAAKSGKRVRLVADDDLYWSSVLNETVGSNMFNEYYKAMRVVKSGGHIKYMQTNENSKLLHHNKYVVFNFKDGSGAVHCGAGNFTKAAFSKNFENFYYITIPEVVETYKAQYKYKFNELASEKSELPKEYIFPKK